MNSKTIVYFVVLFLLGMLIYFLLNNICKCKIVEGGAFNSVASHAGKYLGTTIKETSTHKAAYEANRAMLDEYDPEDPGDNNLKSEFLTAVEAVGLSDTEAADAFNCIDDTLGFASSEFNDAGECLMDLKNVYKSIMTEGVEDTVATVCAFIPLVGWAADTIVGTAAAATAGYGLYNADEAVTSCRNANIFKRQSINKQHLLHLGKCMAGRTPHTCTSHGGGTSTEGVVEYRQGQTVKLPDPDCTNIDHPIIHESFPKTMADLKRNWSGGGMSFEGWDGQLFNSKGEGYPVQNPDMNEEDKFIEMMQLYGIHDQDIDPAEIHSKTSEAIPDSHDDGFLYLDPHKQYKITHNLFTSELPSEWKNDIISGNFRAAVDKLNQDLYQMDSKHNIPFMWGNGGTDDQPIFYLYGAPDQTGKGSAVWRSDGADNQSIEELIDKAENGQLFYDNTGYHTVGGRVGTGSSRDMAQRMPRLRLLSINLRRALTEILRGPPSDVIKALGAQSAYDIKMRTETAAAASAADSREYRLNQDLIRCDSYANQGLCDKGTAHEQGFHPYIMYDPEIAAARGLPSVCGLSCYLKDVCKPSHSQPTSQCLNLERQFGLTLSR